MGDLELVSFKLSMLDECIDLYQKVFSKEPWLENDDIESIKQYFLRFYNINTFIGYVVKSNEKIIAVSIGFLKPWIKGLEYYIDQFYVDDEWQGKGVGSFMLTHIKKDLLRHDVNAIILLTEKQYPAFKFYIKNGFKNYDDMRFLGIGF